MIVESRVNIKGFICVVTAQMTLFQDNGTVDFIELFRPSGEPVCARLQELVDNESTPEYHAAVEVLSDAYYEALANER